MASKLSKRNYLGDSPAPLTLAALEVLSLLQKEDSDQVTRVYATVYGPVHMKIYEEKGEGRQQITEYPADYRRLVESPTEPLTDGTPVAADDHVSMWRSPRDGCPIRFVSQPYQISLSEMRQIVSRCDQLGLEAMVSASSWYFPGTTVRIDYWHPDDQDE